EAPSALRVTVRELDRFLRAQGVEVNLIMHFDNIRRPRKRWRWGKESASCRRAPCRRKSNRDAWWRLPLDSPSRRRNPAADVLHFCRYTWLSRGMRIRIASTVGSMAFHLKWRHGSSRDPNVVSYRDCVVDEDERWHAIGCASGIAILLVVHTSEEPHGEEEIRIISARKASPRERALYHARHCQAAPR